MTQMTVLPSVRPWDKQHDEPASAYEKFLDFLSWGGTMRAWAHERADFYGTTSTALAAQATKYRWISRRTEWQENQAVVSTGDSAEYLRSQIRKRIRYHAALSQKFLSKAEKLIDTYMEKEIIDEETGEVLGNSLVRGVLREAAEALKSGVEMERLSYGLPGTITRVEHDLRNQVEVSLNIYNEVLAILSGHCAECQAQFGEQLAAVQERVNAAQQEVLLLGAGD
jgi:hypothetical protein